jgi:hypothetical protein
VGCPLGSEPVYPYSPFSSDRGLTKRDLFAAMAMQGLLAATDLGYQTNDELARGAVAFADALLAELQK